MTFSSLWPTNLLLFRACVTLRQILALRKPRPVKRARKAAAMCGVWLSVVNCTLAIEPILPPAQSESAIGSIESAEDRIRPLRQIRTRIAPPAGEVPANVAQERFATAPFIMDSDLAGRGWADFVYLWQAPAVSYRSLYFEQPNLERYGHSAGCVLQPMVSGAHFFAAVPLLPVKLMRERPWNRFYPLGYARPGSPAPWLRRR